MTKRTPIFLADIRINVDPDAELWTELTLIASEEMPVDWDCDLRSPFYANYN